MRIVEVILFEILSRTNNFNAKGEYYLTDVVEQANKLGRSCAVVEASSPIEALGVNTMRELAAAELALASWRSSFFNMSGSKVRLASARAGNVIGGGDWSKDRIVPDMVRHLNDETAIPVRNPNAMRPWQHVLEPLKGYLLLAQKLYKSDDVELQSAFNFGPGSNSIRAVRDLVEEGLKHWPGRWDNLAQNDAPHETELLKLTSAKARSLLEWKPRWVFEQAVRYTIDWYRRSNRGELAIELMKEQIDDYLS